MKVNSTGQLQANDSILQTWIGWSELLTGPDASFFVADLDDATDDLLGIFDSGFPIERMEKWLKQWPTPRGWAVFYFQRERGLLV